MSFNLRGCLRVDLVLMGTVDSDHLGLDLERREMDDPDTISTIRSGFEQIITLATAGQSDFLSPAIIRGDL